MRPVWTFSEFSLQSYSRFRERSFFQFFQRCGKGEQMRCRLILLIFEHPIQQGIRKGRVRIFGHEDGRTRTDGRTEWHILGSGLPSSYPPSLRHQYQPSCCPYLSIFTAQCFNSLLEKSLTGLALANVVAEINLSNAEINLSNWKDKNLCPWVCAQTASFFVNWMPYGSTLEYITLIKTSHSLSFLCSNMTGWFTIIGWFTGCNIFWSTAEGRK